MEFHGPRTQILDEGIATNQTTIVYTVPANKKFFLVESMVHPTTVAIGIGYVEIRNGSGVRVRHLNQINIDTQIGESPADHFNPGWPVELPEGYDITIVSNAAGLTVEGDIFGFEVDV